MIHASAGIVDGALTRDLRRTVLRPAAAVTDALPGDDRTDLIHFAVFDDLAGALSTCFIYPESCPWRPQNPGWHLRQMATARTHRGQGFGGAVIAATLDYIAATEGGTLWCNARAAAITFYQRAGFIGHGDLFTDEVHTIAHLRMGREVAAAN